MEALDKAIRTAGGQARLAAKIGCVQGAVSNWKARGKVSAEYCPAIERETGVPCEELNPDVDWAVLRKGTGRRVHKPTLHAPQ
ncbi:MAG: transcriptional regulator [Leptothrix sp. (in: b-proteobacteria)]